MAKDSFVPDDRRPDLPGLPPGLSVEQLARISRFLESRDARRLLAETEVELVRSEENPEEDEGDASGRPSFFALGRFDPTEEAEPLDEDGRVVSKSGEILTATGHRFYAILTLEEPSAYGHSDTTLFAPVYEVGKIVELEIFSQSQDDFAEVLENLRRHAPYQDLEAFPFTYRYFDTSTHLEDPHVDAATGWSRNGRRVMEEAVRQALGLGTVEADPSTE